MSSPLVETGKDQSDCSPVVWFLKGAHIQDLPTPVNKTITTMKTTMNDRNDNDEVDTVHYTGKSIFHVIAN